jgi:hypothetical protein
VYAISLARFFYEDIRGWLACRAARRARAVELRRMVYVDKPIPFRFCVILAASFDVLFLLVVEVVQARCVVAHSWNQSV